MVKFDFKAVSVIAVRRYRCERGIAFGADGYIPIGLSVYNYSTVGIFLVRTVFDKRIPVIHYDINGMYGRCIE